MKAKIYFEKNGVKDHFEVEADDMISLKEKATKGLKQRNINMATDNYWSELEGMPEGESK